MKTDVQLEDQGDWRLEVRVKEGEDGGQKEGGGRMGG